MVNLLGVYSSFSGWYVIFAVEVNIFWFRRNDFIFNQTPWTNGALIIRAQVVSDETLDNNIFSLRVLQNLVTNDI